MNHEIGVRIATPTQKYEMRKRNELLRKRNGREAVALLRSPKPRAADSTSATVASSLIIGMSGCRPMAGPWASNPLMRVRVASSAPNIQK